MSDTVPQENFNRSKTAVQLTVLMLSRMVMNTSLRMVYPFAPALGRGLGVSVTTITNLITIRNLSGIISPLFGPLSERYGRRPILILGLLLFAASNVLLYFVPLLGVLGLTLVLVGIAKVIFDPAMQSYIGDHVPYAYRGRAISFTELSWAGGLFVGGPLVGWLIERGDWRTPFLFLGIASLVMALIVYLNIEPPDPSQQRRIDLREIGHVWRAYPTVPAASLFMGLLMMGNELLFIEYGRFMETSFQLSLTALGLTGSVIGGAEVLGEITSGWSVDRFGKRRVVLLTGVGASIAYLLMPLLSQTLIAALVLLFIMFLAFEITVVGSIPLMTELVPSHRAIVLATTIMAGSLGRAAGSFVGPLMREAFTFMGNGVLAAVITLLATLVLYWRVHEYEE